MSKWALAIFEAAVHSRDIVGWDVVGWDVVGWDVALSEGRACSVPAESEGESTFRVD